MILPFVATDTISCAKLPINSVIAGGGNYQDPSHPSRYAIDNNLATYWSRNGLGSWIQVDLGNQMTTCGVDIAW
jgi:F5/8 type C domain